MSTTSEGEEKYWARESKKLGADARKFYRGDKDEHDKVSKSMHRKMALAKRMRETKGTGRTSDDYASGKYDKEGRRSIQRAYKGAHELVKKIKGAGPD